MNKFVGAKRGAGVLQWLVNQMPSHDVFIDGFLGTGAVTLGKAPASCSIGIDADAISPGLYACQSVPEFTGIIGDARHWLASMLAILDRRGLPAEMPLRDLPGQNAGSYIATAVSTDKILIYLDPPYLGSVRRGRNRRYYRCELMEHSEHMELLSIAHRLASHGCKVMVSGYDSDLYRVMLGGWRLSTFDTITRSGPATECLWCNFPEPTELHDVRYVGADFRERENLKRKKLRWQNKIAAMTPQERQAMREALAEIK